MAIESTKTHRFRDPWRKYKTYLMLGFAVVILALFTMRHRAEVASFIFSLRFPAIVIGVGALSAVVYAIRRRRNGRSLRLHDVIGSIFTGALGAIGVALVISPFWESAKLLVDSDPDIYSFVAGVAVLYCFFHQFAKNIWHA